MSRRGAPKKRAPPPESEHEDSDAGSEGDAIDFSAHAVVKIVQGQLVQETIPLELLQEMRFYGSSSEEGLWDPVTISLDGTNIKITKPKLAKMSDEEVSKIIKHLLCAAGWNYNPVRNSEEEMFTGYASVHHLPKLVKRNDKFTTVIVNDESIDNVISFNHTTKQIRKLYTIEDGDHQLMKWCKDAKISGPMTAQLQTIMKVLMERVPDPESQHKQEKRKAATTQKSLQVYMGALHKAGAQVDALARRGQAEAEIERKKHEVLQRATGLHEDLQKEVREGRKANMIGSILGPAIKKAYMEVETAVKKIDRLADNVSTEAGIAPSASMSVERLKNLETEMIAKLTALKPYYADARKHNEMVNESFQLIAGQMMDLDKHCKQSTWVEKSSKALEKAKSDLLLKQSQSKSVANDVSQAKNTTGSGFSKALALAANFLGGGRILPVADAEAEDSRGEGGKSTEAPLGKRKTDEAEQVGGGGAAAKEARRTSRRGQ